MKNILITGGSRGIGLALVKKFSANNYNVITMSRSAGPLESLKNVVYIKGDVNVSDHRNKLISIINQLKLDGVINNAGYGMPYPLKLTTIEEIDKHFQTNFLSPVKLLKEILQKNKLSRVVNISTGAANKPLQSLFAYCTSKAAMHHAIKCLNIEYPETKFINIKPGLVKTDLYEKWSNVESHIFPDGNFIKEMGKTRGLISAEKVADYIFDIWRLPDNEFLKDWEL